MELMNMDGIFWWIIQALVGGFAAVLWSLYSELKTKMEKLDDEFSSYRTESASKWVTRDEMERAIAQISQTLDRNADRLDSRFDRLEERILERERRP